MRFELDETQQVIVQVAGEVLDSSGADLPDRVWKALGQAGMLSLAVPTWLDGDGFGVLEISVLLAEIGRRAVAVPALATLALGVLPVVRWGSPDQQRELLSGIVTDGAVLTAAVREPSDPMPSVPACVGSGSPQLTVTGTKVGVAFAEQAHHMLVPVSLAAGGAGVALIDPSAPGVTLRRTHSSSGAPEYTVELAGAGATGLLGGDAGGGAVEDLYRCAIAGACAVGDGAVAGALALTAAHVGTREQFGRPLATFQAVAQEIADVYVAARTLHLATVSACWRLDTDRAAGADLDVAAYWLASEAPTALRTCHQLHGGLGLDISYPLHRYSALTKDLVRFLGGTEHCLDRLGGRDVHRPV
jgi:alkylation response protein AidB-like acyl-CoA dehydrogenase